MGGTRPEGAGRPRARGPAAGARGAARAGLALAAAASCAAALALPPALAADPPAGAPAAAAAPGAAPAPCPPELFRIRRSTNANELVYAARLDDEGQLDEDDPLRVYWLMLAEDGHREGLNILEKMLAYGFTAEPAPQGGFRVVLKAKKDRPLHLALRGRCPVAYVEIAGRPALLRSIYVQTSSGGVVPTVAHVDMAGVDPTTGREITERILPN